MAACPTCRQSSGCVHSSYTRTCQDLPIGERAVRIHLRVRRFRCSNARCRRQTFTERLPALLPSYVQRTMRLSETIREAGFALGGEAGVRLLRKMQIATSSRTLLRLVRNAPTASAGAVRIVGVDDWAMRKGRTYGTIVIDLERHRPIDLLPDRSAATLAAWLKQHPEVEIVARDRATEYACGVSEGAPTAMQVADRWHLLQNLRQMLERFIQRLFTHLKQLSPVDEPHSSASAQVSAPRTRLRLDAKDRAAMAASRAKSVTLYQEVQQLRTAGRNIRQIARQLAMSRTTIRKYFYADAFPERAQQQPTLSILDAYLPYLEERHQAGCEDAKLLWREIRAQGYPGAYVQVSRWLRQRRRTVADTTPGPYRDAMAVAIQQRESQSRPADLPSYKQLAWSLIQDPNQLEPAQTLAIRRICQHSQIAQTYQLAQQFRAMIRNHEAPTLDSWLNACAASNISDLMTFATGIRHDYAAVRAALATRWSNGQTEGQVNRLKYLKRQMYGRANFDLLRQRVLHPN